MKGSEWRVGMFYFIFARIAAQQRQAYYVQLLCSTCMDVNKRRVQQPLDSAICECREWVCLQFPAAFFTAIGGWSLNAARGKGETKENE